MKILLIVEGKKTEVNLVNHLLNIYDLNVDYDVYSYCTNIYDLYDRMFKNHEDELDSLDLLLTLKSKEPNNPLFDESYSDILLCFDYDPQDHKFDREKLEIMMQFFHESTDEGKLYLSYPMIESYKHFKILPDLEFKNRTVRFEDLQNKRYKEIVHQETAYPGVFDLNKGHFDCIIALTLQKALMITNELKNDFPILKQYNSLDLNKVLDVQNDLLQSARLIYVLNTCIFYICDYAIGEVSFEREL